jgi:prepilin-type processing-associated H-X9-DG protein
MHGYRYDGQASIVFYDGHVSTMTKAGLMASPEIWEIIQ